MVVGEWFLGRLVHEDTAADLGDSSQSSGDFPLPGRPPSRSLSPEESEIMRTSFCAKYFAKLLLKLEGLCLRELVTVELT